MEKDAAALECYLPMNGSAEAAGVVLILGIIVVEEGGDAGGFARLALGFEAGLFVEESDVFLVCVLAGLFSHDDRFWDIAGLWPFTARRLEFS